MSILLVRDEIRRFLATPEPEVLCITGKWGVGKTFAWIRYLKECSDQKGVALDRYSYVSLFGQNSLNELKYAIFEGAIPISRIDKGPDFTSLKKSFDTINQFGRKSLVLANVLPAAREYLEGAGRALFLAVHDQIVCIDDLERAGKGIEVKDVLGLVAFLTEQRRCKVVLLLNQEELSDESAGDFASQLEKVIDERVTFSPTPSEAAAIAVSPDTTFHEMLSADCVSLGLVNLRVIARIERLCRRLAELLKGYDVSILKQAVHTATLFGWIHYQPNDAPPFEFVREFSPYRDLLTGKNDASDQEKAWRSLLTSYGFTNTDEFDLVILDGLQAGFLDPVALKKAADALQKQIEHQKRDNSFTQAWQLYHDSFRTTADEVLDKISKAFRENVDVITPINLAGTVTLFKDLGRADEAKELLRYYMEHRHEGREFYDLKGSVFGGEVKDPDVIASFSEKLPEFKDERDPGKILINIKRNSGWNPEDIERLAELSPDDFRKLFTDNSGVDMRTMISAALQFSSFGNASDEMKKVAANATEALRRIGRESEINARRVRSYGISVEQQVEPPAGNEVE